MSFTTVPFTDTARTIGETFEEQLEQAVSAPSLTAALVHIAICENERIVRGVAKLMKENPDLTHPGYESAFGYCFRRVMEEWPKKHSVPNAR